MAEYLEPAIEVDPDELHQDSLEFMESVIPGFEPAAAGLVGFILAATARMGAVGAEYASAAMTTVFVGLGESVHGIPRIRATSATVDTTWTMSAPGPHTIPAGLLVEVEGTPDNAGFETVEQVEIPTGATSTAVGEVALVAVEQGAQTSGLAGPGTVAEATDLPVTSIVLTSPTAGGRDEETVDDYLNRLTGRLRLLTSTPILPEDFATLARDVPGVARALALDGYDPTNDTVDNERMVTVAIRDAAGETLSTDIKDTVEALLEGEREVNFIVHVIDPTYSEIDVAFAAVCYPGSDPDQVEAAAIAAVGDLLSPASHGQPPFGDQTLWYQVDTLRFQEVSTAINNTPGLDHWTALGIGRRRSATVAASTDVVTASDHGYANGDTVVFRSLTGGAGLAISTQYFVRDATANTFKVALTAGGAAINVTSDATAARIVHLDTDDIPLDGAAPLPRPGTIVGNVVAA